ncbi:MAG TPA: hypothetical protein ENH94_04605 [Phycisphaerales bacterium]|nr:hypothetical protein [Phycisphaerales bacterium]
MARETTDFGSSDDGRELGVWQSKYSDAKAKRQIRYEAVYTIILLVIAPAFLLIIWQYKCSVADADHGKSMLLDANDCNLLCRYAYAWAAGLYGGAVFATKWLYHSIGKGFWHSDRWGWRILSPLVSSAVAVAFIWIIDAEFITIFNKEAAQETPVVLASAFLIGLFSDGAIAKMSDIADALFGTTTKKFTSQGK